MKFYRGIIGEKYKRDSIYISFCDNKNNNILNHISKIINKNLTFEQFDINTKTVFFYYKLLYNDFIENEKFVTNFRNFMFDNYKEPQNYYLLINNNSIIIEHDDTSKLKDIYSYVSSRNKFNIEKCYFYKDIYNNKLYSKLIVSDLYVQSNIIEIKEKFESNDCEKLQKFIYEIRKDFTDENTSVEYFITSHEIVPMYVTKNDNIEKICKYIGSTKEHINIIKNKFKKL